MLFSTSTFDSSKLDNPSYALCWLSRNYHRSCLEHHTFTPRIINNSTNQNLFSISELLGKQPLYPKTRGKCTEHRGVEPRTELTKNRIRPRQQGSRLSSYQYPRYLTWLSRGTSSLTRLFFSNRSFSCPYPRSITFSNHISVEVSYLR